MTSINAIRFDDHSGALVCDEQRHWNPERMKVFAADKIRPVVPAEVTAAHRLAAAYGNTGTSTIGEELRLKIAGAVKRRYREAVDRAGGPPERFLSMEEMGALVFAEQAALKTRHVDEQMRGRYGFATADLVAGRYEKDGSMVEIGSSEIAQAAELLATWKDRKGDARPVFGNGGLLAGYAPEDGFRIFLYSMAEGYWSPVEAAFLALGSGLDAANLVFSGFASRRAPEGGGGVDPVEGVMTAVSAVNAAARNNLGVGGYFNILLVDGRAEDPARILREIHDHRSKLASEIVKAQEEAWIPKKAGRDLIRALLFEDAPFEAVLADFHGAARSPDRLRRQLRGWTV